MRKETRNDVVGGQNCSKLYFNQSNKIQSKTVGAPKKELTPGNVLLHLKQRKDVIENDEEFLNPDMYTHTNYRLDKKQAEKSLNIQFILPTDFKKARKMPVQRSLLGNPLVHNKTGHQRRQEIRL